MTDLFGKVDTEKVKRSIYKVSEHIETIRNNCNLFNLDTIVKNLKRRRTKSKKLKEIIFD